ncbi:hypothetical protein P153DRAFT_391251 [Dothidotthia symphoricarpi CBS 119687]|uniref:Uncharacterized protein n=1 Tax=Dothidotthia symphoricarpi CBS 119687 TaxID=1392245 RepID=A0A6A5ZVQ6_9PLEO|nr:uncharacterized protein P153DRAFT_391251 [Dothidotthia symphoricarpi CBS 119687]KAF2123822.1 hypothetical protein P153DRAFT_391251 [Dothidotthia symphoricarpi CBS 119687]
MFDLYVLVMLQPGLIHGGFAIRAYTQDGGTLSAVCEIELLLNSPLLPCLKRIIVNRTILPDFLRDGSDDRFTLPKPRLEWSFSKASCLEQSSIIRHLPPLARASTLEPFFIIVAGVLLGLIPVGAAAISAIVADNVSCNVTDVNTTAEITFLAGNTTRAAADPDAFCSELPSRNRPKP